MMEEYIKLGDVLNILNDCRCSDCTNDKSKSCQLCQLQNFFDKLMNDTPIIILAEPKVGKWIGSDPATWACSVCHYRVARWNNTLYCPACGAKMEDKPWRINHGK